MLKHELLFGHKAAAAPPSSVGPGDGIDGGVDPENGLCVQYDVGSASECGLSALRRLGTGKYFEFNKGSSPIADGDRLRATPSSSPIKESKTRRRLQFEADGGTESEWRDRANRSVSATPIGSATQCLMAALRRRGRGRRRASDCGCGRRRDSENAPFRVLDAPGIVDDFYSSIMDWNARRNLIGVALTDRLYLYHPESAAITPLIGGEGDGDGDDNAQRRRPRAVMTAVKMAPSGEAVAVGTDDGVVTVWDIDKERAVQVGRRRVVSFSLSLSLCKHGGPRRGG